MPGSIELLTTKELAKILSVSKLTLQEWRKLGKGPAFTKPGKIVYYRAEDVRAWAEENLGGARKSNTPTGAHHTIGSAVGASADQGGANPPTSLVEATIPASAL